MNEPEYEISPEELQKTLIGFLGHTYKEVSQFDSRLISANQTLSPKKQEFQNIANKVIGETVGPINPQHHNRNIPANGPVQHNLHQQQLPQQEHVQNYNDPNQMEFSFDNSVTAISINNRLDDIEKKLKRLDIAISKVLVLLEENDTKNSKQD